MIYFAVRNITSSIGLFLMDGHGIILHSLVVIKLMALKNAHYLHFNLFQIIQSHKKVLDASAYESFIVDTLGTVFNIFKSEFYERSSNSLLLCSIISMISVRNKM